MDCLPATAPGLQIGNEIVQAKNKMFKGIDLDENNKKWLGFFYKIVIDAVVVKNKRRLFNYNQAGKKGTMLFDIVTVSDEALALWIIKIQLEDKQDEIVKQMKAMISDDEQSEIDGEKDCETLGTMMMGETKEPEELGKAADKEDPSTSGTTPGESVLEVKKYKYDAKGRKRPVTTKKVGDSKNKKTNGTKVDTVNNIAYYAMVLKNFGVMRKHMNEESKTMLDTLVREAMTDKDDINDAKKKKQYFVEEYAAGGKSRKKVKKEHMTCFEWPQTL